MMILVPGEASLYQLESLWRGDDKVELHADMRGPVEAAASFVEAAANGIKERGKAELGDKTMLDVWIPAAETIKKTSIAEEDIIEILKQGALKAKQAMDSTKDMLSKKGRSSKLGERSKGHIDPGAASSAMIISTFFEAIRNLDNI